MAFLTLNGVTVPTAKGGEVSPQEIGGRSRSPNGSLFLQRVGIKRRWRFQTVPLLDAEARAFEGFIQGLGHRWRFDPGDEDNDPIFPGDDTGAVTHLFSDKGLGPAAAYDHAVESNTAADGDAVQFLASAPATYVDVGKFSGSVWAGRATTNLVAANERDCESSPATDFTSVSGATLSTDTANYWQGSQSLGIVANGVNDGASTSAITISGDVYFSVYVKGDAGGESWRVKVQETVGGATYTETTFTAKANTWVRVGVAHTNSGSATAATVQVLSNDASGKVYIDGLQVEEGVAYPTAWVDGSRSSASIIDLPTSVLQDLKSLSVSFWTRGSHSPADGISGYVFNFGANTATLPSRMGLFHNQSDTKLYFRYYDRTGSNSDAITTTTFAPENTLSHIAATVDYDGSTIKIYVDGTEEDSTSLSSTHDFSTLANPFFRLGWGTSSTNGYHGWFSDLKFFPYALSADMVSDIASATVEDPKLPILGAAGDAVGDEIVQVLGRVQNSKYIGTSRSGTWKSNDRVVTFELEEV